MRWTLITLAAALALAAGCDKSPDASKGASSAPTPPQAASGGSSPTTPANTGAPTTMDEKKEGANPTQGQVDPKDSDQHRDFKRNGDGAGPKSAETQPRPGN